MSKTLALACSALALCLTLSLAPAAQAAEDAMMHKDTMMHKGGMKKHKKKGSMMMSHDSMKKEAPAQ